MTVGAGAGVLVAGQRRRMMASDPSRGPLRRTAGTLLTPVSPRDRGLRGAVLGPQDARRRSYKSMGRAQLNAVKAANAANTGGGGKTKATGKADTGSTASPAGRVTRIAGTPNPNISKNGTARDTATVGPVTPRRPPPNPARAPGPSHPAKQQHQPPTGSPETVAIPRPGPPPQTDQILRPPRVADTVAIPGPAPPPQTDQIPRPTPTQQIPRPAPPDPSTTTAARLSPPAAGADGNDDGEPGRRPLESASAGQK